MDKIIEVKCTMCSWEGKETELKTVAIKGISCCPNCYNEDLETVDED